MLVRHAFYQLSYLPMSENVLTLQFSWRRDTSSLTQYVFLLCTDSSCLSALSIAAVPKPPSSCLTQEWLFLLNLRASFCLPDQAGHKLMHCPRHDWSSPSTLGLLSHAHLQTGMLAVCYIKAPHLCRDSGSHPFPVFQARATSHFLHLLQRQWGGGSSSLLRALQATITHELLLSLDVETEFFLCV